MNINYLHSIYLNNDIHSVTSLSERILSNINAARHCYPESHHSLYDLESGRQFLVDHMSPEVVKAFDDLIPLAYKSDLLRYALLYVYGGLYADLSVHLFYPLPEVGPKTEIMIFREGFSAAPWAVSTSLIAALPGQPLFAKCVDAIIKHIATGFYGTNALCPTGPNLFGATLAAEVPLYKLSSGETTRINRSATHAYAYRDANGDVVAVNIKRGIGLSSVGASHHDDYNEHYRNRTIYQHEVNAPRIWTLEDFASNGWLRAPTGAESDQTELMSFGPYATLEAGSYRAIYTLSASIPDEHLGNRLVADVCENLGQQLIPVTRPIQEQTDSGYIQYSVEFKLEIHTSNLEVRLFAVRPQEFNLISLSIESLS